MNWMQAYGESARDVWQGIPLDVVLGDFTELNLLLKQSDRFNLLICNPPYVRHHHISNGDKSRLQKATEAACGVRIAGLAGLYCYFLGLSHGWMQSSGIAGWLIPSEFMDVNYGRSVKKYLLRQSNTYYVFTVLTLMKYSLKMLLCPRQFVWFRNEPPPTDHQVRIHLWWIPVIP